jgi:hypothetical protein
MPGRTTRNRSSSTPAPAPAPAPEPVPQLLQQAFDAYVPLSGYGDQLCPAVFATARGIRDADSAAAGADINVGFRQQSGGFKSVQEYTKGDLRIILSNGGCLFGKFSARVLFTTLMVDSTQALDAHPTAAAVVAGISAALLEATADPTDAAASGLTSWLVDAEDATRLVIGVLPTSPDSPQFATLVAAYAAQDQAAMKSPADEAAERQMEADLAREKAEEEQQQAAATATQRSIEAEAAQKAREDAILALATTAKAAALSAKKKRKRDLEASKKDGSKTDTAKKDGTKNTQVRQSAEKLGAAYAKAESERPSISVISDDEGATKSPRRSSSNPIPKKHKSDDFRSRGAGCGGRLSSPASSLSSHRAPSSLYEKAESRRTADVKRLLEDTLSFASSKGKGSAFSNMGPPYAALALAVCEAYTALNVTMTATKDTEGAVDRCTKQVHRARSETAAATRCIRVAREPLAQLIQVMMAHPQS